MYEKNVEEALLAMLHKYQAAKHTAERKLAAVREEVVETEQAITHAQFMWEAYRKEYGLPTHIINHSPVMEDTYAHMGPTELVERWAGQHEGEVIIKELTRVGLSAGIFKKYNNGASSIYTVLKRKKYEQISPGRYKKVDHIVPMSMPRFVTDPLDIHA